MQLLLFGKVLGFFDDLDVLKLSDLEFLGHFSRIQLEIKLFANDIHQMHFSVIADDRSSMI